MTAPQESEKIAPSLAIGNPKPGFCPGICGYPRRIQGAHTRNGFSHKRLAPFMGGKSDYPATQRIEGSISVYVICVFSAAIK